MSYDRDKSNFKEANELLKVVLPEYEFISKARGMNEPGVLQDGGKKYKATDNAGNVYLVRNPAAWPTRTTPNGETIRYRPHPELIMTFAELKKAAANQVAYEVKTEPKKLLDKI